MSIQDSNPQPLVRESPSITTRSGLPPCHSYFQLQFFIVQNGIAYCTKRDSLLSYLDGLWSFTDRRQSER